MKQCIYVKKYIGSSNSLIERYNYLKAHYPCKYRDSYMQIYDISSLGSDIRYVICNIKAGVCVGMINSKYEPIELVKFGGF